MKTNKTIIAFLSVITVLLLAVGSVSVMSIMQTQKAIDALTPEDKKPTREDGVVIAENYEIQSTLPVSDAYKSGDTSVLDDKQKETLDMASEVLSKIIKDKMTDYEKEKAVYDWMTSQLQNDVGLLTVIPESDADSDSPYGTLKNHNAVCVGYATTFRLFMQMLDIPCMVIHNTSLYHSWNLVQLDGDWYHTDIYSDIGSGNYQNFNMNDELSSTGHDWDKEFFPAAISLKYNYLYKNAKKLDDVYKVPALIKKALDKKQKNVSLLFPSSFTEQQAQIVSTMVDSIDSSLSEDELITTYMSCSFCHVENNYLCIITIDIDEESSDRFSDETVSKMREAVEKYFPNACVTGENYEDYDGMAVG